MGWPCQAAMSFFAWPPASAFYFLQGLTFLGGSCDESCPVAQEWGIRYTMVWSNMIKFIPQNIQQLHFVMRTILGNWWWTQRKPMEFPLLHSSSGIVASPLCAVGPWTWVKIRLFSMRSNSTFSRLQVLTWRLYLYIYTYYVYTLDHGFKSSSLRENMWEP